ncbi:spore germination protein, GerA family [Desulfosporosinus acidiphilus SJ4]|uniref:Spore germination protein, GerA family n=1 Tax=Desulfosporosinus acidiphilus (strain DSM 22704 / JCM 16185 / SJ4) TaxID=646529 RepID=I4DB41_DESAJ|nr:spore germination protein [Desulfosporosinus acidiphilus]AFM43015.1 spore germination protein, GerA family [Desulfosporosinus acidiphilus SJ4]
MYRLISRKLRFLQLLNRSSSEENGRKILLPTNLSDSLAENITMIKKILGQNFDFVIREFELGSSEQNRGALIFLSGMTDKNMINESILKPLMHERRFNIKNENSEFANMEMVKMSMLSVGEVDEVIAIDEVVDGCLSGSTVLLIDGAAKALVLSTPGWQTRSVEEPTTESVVRGPREGFTESLLTNTTLLRRKLKNPGLILETMSIGRQTRTKVCTAYIKEIANPCLIEEIRYRLSKISTDSILESGYIEQYIEDNPFSIFTQVGNSEKPDAVAAKLLEGRAAILVDGTPVVLTVPMLFLEGFQSAEDYYSRPYLVNLIRFLRFLAFFLSILGPATYVALTTFHQELIPTTLLLTMVSAQSGVPFPAVGEALIMGITFEILREAGIRLPRPVGQAISIVGALVIGQSAVSAGLVGAPMVIVVGITAVSSFVVPVHVDSGSILRLIFTILAGFIGGFGIMIGVVGTLIHLASLRSFGTPYLSPLAPLSVADLKDSLIKVSIWAMLTRPRTIGWHNTQRQDLRIESEKSPEEIEEHQK